MSDFIEKRRSEKVELQELNDRFASFIAKVHSLEEQNGTLQEALDQYKSENQHGQPNSTNVFFQKQLKDLQYQMDEIEKERDQCQLEKDNLAVDVSLLSQRLTEEAKNKKDAEENLRSIRKDLIKAHLTVREKERKVKFLMTEIEILKTPQDEEIKDAPSYPTQQNKTEVDSTKFKLAAALKEIRGQYDRISLKSKHESEDLYKSKINDLTESLGQARQEARKFRTQTETLTHENESLKKRMNGMEKQHQTEVYNYQGEISTLKDEIDSHLQKHQDLLDVKMTLDNEITTYRSLLEVEENRIDKSSDQDKEPNPEEEEEDSDSEGDLPSTVLQRLRRLGKDTSNIF